ncbi:MAG: 16S rRNA (cytosine(1402)-N(4))-methyltransferase RsmH [Desulfobulbaceae bacterium]
METWPPALHIPVLEREVLEMLRPMSGGIYVDGTLGLGGHARSILEASGPDGRVIGFEWDRQAADYARKRLEGYGERFFLIEASYAEFVPELRNIGVREVNGLLLDLGVSSLQLDSGERGFSFRSDAPLDMRMDQRRGETAAQLVGRLSRDELADIFYNYGEERQARRIAARLVEAREKAPIMTTGQLAELVAEAIPKKFHPEKIHVATRVFQALRIAVNRELDNLLRILGEAPAMLARGGRICVISFHSIEDRIVKQMFRTRDDLKVVTRRPVEPGPEERERNPRARSAKLRVAEKV